MQWVDFSNLKIQPYFDPIGVLFDDELNHTNEVVFHAFCAIDDRVPLILGFKSLLERFTICFNISSGVAYLEE